MSSKSMTTRSNGRQRGAYHDPPYLLADRRRMSISRMLDMGGMPSASNDRTVIRTVNASKNCKLQAIAFDFQILLKGNSNDNVKGTVHQNSTHSLSSAPIPEATSERKLQPTPQADLTKIQQVASLLKVDLESGLRKNTTNNEDDVSAIINAASTSHWTSGGSAKSARTSMNSPTTTFPHEDVRAKYARKLQGGIAGLELAKSQVGDALSRGDAAGHLSARKLAMQTPVDPKHSAKGSRWIASAETSRLLSFLTHRSIRIALLPHPSIVNNPQSQEEEEQSMRALSAQLNDVVVDIIVPKLTSSEPAAIRDTIQKNVLNELQMSSNLVMMVSDRDDYLQAARDLGMQTCRLQRKNARRGNISANFTSTSIDDVQEVVNEINGISFNSVVNR